MDRNEIARGKTKTLWEVAGRPDICIVQNRDDITKYDRPELTSSFPGKAALCTSVNTHCMRLLRDCGLPVAFREEISDTEFLADRCTMLPLECVICRTPYRDGSYVKRHPEVMQMIGPDRSWPRFHRLEMSFFLKTTGRKVVTADGRHLGTLEGYPEDPLIVDPYHDQPRLVDPKVPAWDPRSAIVTEIPFWEALPQREELRKMERLTRQAFLILEKALGMEDWCLQDLKIEFGRNADGDLCIADVVDPDTWRMEDEHGFQLSKELFRQGKPMEEVEAAYRHVEDLSRRLRIPRHALICWRGSASDPLPKWVRGNEGRILGFEEDFPGVELIDVVCSAHKKTVEGLSILEKQMARFPRGGVIIGLIGMSNGAGPTLGSHTTWQMVSVCTTKEKSPVDVYSTINAPSGVGVVLAPDADNAFLTALNMFALAGNPVAYMRRQIDIEDKDQYGLLP